MAKIDNLKELVSLVFEMGEAISESLEDGKISIMDAPHFVGIFKKIGPALEGIDEIPAELADIDDAELDELIDFISEEFDIDNEELEAKVEEGLELGLKLAHFVSKVI